MTTITKATMKFAASMLLSAAALIAADINTPSDVKAVVFHANAGICQTAVSMGIPCTQHITVMLYPHQPDAAIYQVSVTYTTNYGAGERQTWVKRVVPTDTTGMTSVTFLAPDVVIESVKVERL